MLISCSEINFFIVFIVGKFHCIYLTREPIRRAPFRGNSLYERESNRFEQHGECCFCKAFSAGFGSGMQAMHASRQNAHTCEQMSE